MAKVSYDQIEPNIAEVDVSGSTVEVTWKCPVSGRVVTSSSATMSADSGVTRQVTTSLKRGMVSEAVGFLSKLVSSMVGGAVGRVVQGATVPARIGLERELTKTKFGPDAERKAVVAAFEQVKERFRWDEDRELFVAVNAD